MLWCELHVAHRANAGSLRRVQPPRHKDYMYRQIANVPVQLAQRHISRNQPKCTDHGAIQNGSVGGHHAPNELNDTNIHIRLRRPVGHEKQARDEKYCSGMRLVVLHEEL